MHWRQQEIFQEGKNICQSKRYLCRIRALEVKTEVFLQCFTSSTFNASFKKRMFGEGRWYWWGKVELDLSPQLRKGPEDVFFIFNANDLHVLWTYSGIPTLDPRGLIWEPFKLPRYTKRIVTIWPTCPTITSLMTEGAGGEPWRIHT